MRGGGAYLFASENNTALEGKNQKILVQIKELQAEFESEDSLKKRNQIQEKIDTLKKQYTENILSDEKPAQTNPPKAIRRQTTQTTLKQKNKTLKDKQSGFFLGIVGGGFGRTTFIDVTSYLPLQPCYHRCEYDFDDKGGGAFLRLGGQKMYSDYFGERFYFSAGAFGAGFWSMNSDILISFPIGGKVSFGFYFGVGTGFLWNTGTYDITYITSKYSLEPKSELMLNLPAGIALAFGHSRIELGYFAMVGILAMNKYVSTQDHITASHLTQVQGVTLAYQYTF